jgi:hypothetical protein
VATLRQACVASLRPFALISLISVVDEYGVHPQSTPDQPLHGEFNFGDSSGPFFSMYSKATDDEDNKMVERWQKDADGILIFVSPRVGIHISP